MEFRQLQTFTTVVENKSFSRAAQLLQISQPTVSLHIQQLEEELGTQLILRTTKSIEITATGQNVYEYARDIIRLEQRLLEDCSDAGRHTIHLGASTIPSGYILPEVLAGFTEKNPDVHFMIEQGDSAQIIEKLENGLIDLALVGMKPENVSLEATPFYQDEVILITPAIEKFRGLQDDLSVIDDPDSYAGEILNLLLREQFILREEGSGSMKAGEMAMEELGVLEADLHVSARMNDTEAIKNMVAGGLGVSIISEKAARNDLEQGRILAFHFPGEGCHRKFYLLRRAGVVSAQAPEKFRRYLLAYYHAAGNGCG